MKKHGYPRDSIVFITGRDEARVASPMTRVPRGRSRESVDVDTILYLMKGMWASKVGVTPDYILVIILHLSGLGVIIATHS